MADLTRDAPLRFRFPDQLKIERWVLDNSSAQTVYKGQPLIIDASEDTRYLRGYVDAITLVSGSDVFVGIANEGCTVATTDTETDNEIEVIVSGEVGFKNSSLTDADVGKTIVMADSGTIATGSAGSGYLEIGKLVRVADGYAYVEINPGGYPKIQSF